MKVSLEIDAEEYRTSVEWEGNLDKKQILELIQSLKFPSMEKNSPSSSAPSTSQSINEYEKQIHKTTAHSELTKKEKLKYFIYMEFKENWFKSKEVKRRYEDYFEEIGLSTVSTYLSRMAREDFLIKKGNRSEREYKLSDEAKEKGVKEIEKKIKA
ncbi:MAG: hypothetical protein BTN85_0642 [Candidatus Methanohalarchaeum thermophilum]|uniref:Uncharacterized protein n=1 Tax=Methanohalarchaeum thermophilum TaxID=1903181 RepID=A0A1Q6DUZ4_METT1|nr:MAG: hypothetical protein BTN85_0642 [Candidatus Methanohalarchaeum thermophilum]